MDRVRFGRVLGRGARLAARTVYEAVDAATSAPPAAAGQPRTVQSSVQPGHRDQPRRAPAQTQQPVSRPMAPSQIQRGRNSGRPSMLAPVKRASRAVSLEITGSFFALFAFAFGVAAWRSREAAAGLSLSRTLIYCAVALLFAYFAGSNFVRAKRLN